MTTVRKSAKPPSQVSPCSPIPPPPPPISKSKEDLRIIIKRREIADLKPFDDGLARCVPLLHDKHFAGLRETERLSCSQLGAAGGEVVGSGKTQCRNTFGARDGGARVGLGDSVAAIRAVGGDRESEGEGEEDGKG